MTYTLGIIKPGAVARGYAGAIIKQIKEAGFTIKKQENRRMTLGEAKRLYAAHKDRPFYQHYCRYMSSTPVVIMLLAEEDAVTNLRKIMGATNPAEADDNTIRSKYGISIEENAIHGSDSEGSAEREIGYFFGDESK